jgi:hypothetical protein
MHLTSEAMLARLVGLNTVSCNSNLELIGMARAWLEAHGACCRLSYDPPGRKANLHAILGPVGPGGLAFAGHVDTVSADGQSWSGDPFTLRRRDGRLIGRGACDMKGFVASLLAAVPDIAALPLLRPVHVLLTYDEEVGYHGARRLIADLAESGLQPASCVVGEPSGMRPILAQKGRLVVEVAVRGKAAHSCAALRGQRGACRLGGDRLAGFTVTTPCDAWAGRAWLRSSLHHAAGARHCQHGSAKHRAWLGPVQCRVAEYPRGRSEAGARAVSVLCCRRGRAGDAHGLAGGGVRTRHPA